MAKLRTKPDGDPLSARFYMRILWDGPFAHNPAATVDDLLDDAERGGYTVDRNITDMKQTAQQIKDFYVAFSEKCENGSLTKELTHALVDEWLPQK